MNTIPFESKTYKKRRDKLRKLVGHGRILLLGNDHSSVNYEHNWYPFRQDSTFLYYFGIDLPGLAAVLDCDRDEDIIFGNELTMDDIIWTGELPSLESQAERVGVKKVKPFAKLIEYISLDTHFLPPYRPEHSITIGGLIGKKARKVAKRASKKLIKAICAQREIKTEEEIIQMDIATKITHEMHLSVMSMARPGMKAYELVAEASRVARSYNVPFSFLPIMTTAGQVLHSHDYTSDLQEGDLLLFDGGCEAPSRYSGDITRTFPVSQRYTDRQKEIYSIVLKALNDTDSMARAGETNLDLHKCASKVITEGLKNLGLIKGNVDDAMEQGVHTLFFQHGIGHMIGLDVHDMENFGEDHIGYDKQHPRPTSFGWRNLRLGRELKEGFGITIEPGIYFIPQLIDKRRAEGAYADFVNYDEVDKWRDFGGIRIEDDYIIRADHAQKLGANLVREIEDVEAVRRV